MITKNRRSKKENWVRSYKIEPSSKRKNSLKLTSVVFDDLLFLEELGEVFALGESDDLPAHVGDVGFHVDRNRGAFVVVFSDELLAAVLISDCDDIADLELEAGDVHRSTVDGDMSVGDHLPRLENRSCVAEPPDRSREAELQESQEVQAGVAVHSLRFFKRAVELLFQHVVVAADDLLCK